MPRASICDLAKFSKKLLWSPEIFGWCVVSIDLPLKFSNFLGNKRISLSAIRNILYTMKTHDREKNHWMYLWREFQRSTAKEAWTVLLTDRALYFYLGTKFQLTPNLWLLSCIKQLTSWYSSLMKVFRKDHWSIRSIFSCRVNNHSSICDIFG